MNEIMPKDNAKIELATAQAFTADWADLGLPINVRDIKNIGLYLNIDANNSTGLQYRIVTKDTPEDTDVHSPIIESIAIDGITVAPQSYTLASNTDQKLVTQISPDDIVAYIQVQIKATVVGVTAGTVTAKVSFQYIQGRSRLS